MSKHTGLFTDTTDSYGVRIASYGLEFIRPPKAEEAIRNGGAQVAVPLMSVRTVPVTAACL